MAELLQCSQFYDISLLSHISSQLEAMLRTSQTICFTDSAILICSLFHAKYVMPGHWALHDKCACVCVYYLLAWIFTMVGLALLLAHFAGAQFCCCCLSKCVLQSFMSKFVKAHCFKLSIYTLQDVAVITDCICNLLCLFGVGGVCRQEINSRVNKVLIQTTSCPISGGCRVNAGASWD